MAKLSKRLFEVSGALGDLVFKEMEGTPYIATRPVSFMPGTDEASVARRERFGVSSKMSKVILKMRCIKSAWLTYNRKKRPYRQIVSANYHKVKINDVPASISLVPDNGFDLVINEFTLTSHELNVAVAPLGRDKGIDPDAEVRIAMAGFIFLSDPVGDNIERYDYFDLDPELQTLDLDSALSFSLKLSNCQTNVYNTFQKQKAYCAFLTLDSAKNVIHYSKNITQ